MNRDRILTWLSRVMYLVAGVAVASLILEYAFFLGPRERLLLHLVDLLVVGIFLADGALRFAFAAHKPTFVRAHWPALTIMGLIVTQLILVSQLEVRGWLPAFLEVRSVFSLTKGYIIVLQMYLVFLVAGQAIRANKRLASLRIRPVRTVAFSFVFVILVGALLLSTPKATREGTIAPIDALFTATSAVCVTGLTVVDTGHYYTGFGQGTILALIQIGGLGLMTFTAFFALLMRKGLGMREELIAGSMVGYETMGMVARTLRTIVGITFLTEGVGAGLLFLSTRPEFGSAGRAIAASVFHAVSAFCNAGFSLYSTNLERFAAHVPVNLTITSLIIIGGLGFPVLMNLLGMKPLAAHPDRTRWRWSVHSRIVLLMTAALLLIGTVGFLLLERNGILAGRPFGERVLVSYFQSVTARTAGFNTVRIGWLAVPTIFLITALMFIGGSPGGTAGGVKTSTFGVVLASIGSMFGGKGRVELFRRRIPDRAVREALVVVAMGIVVVSLATFALLITEKRALSDVLFEVVSAFGTVGLSTGMTAGLSTVGKAVLILVMLTGRIGPLTLALAIGQRAETPTYDYPEARVLVG
jgi:trk system potassium uptake protein TrkH